MADCDKFIMMISSLTDCELSTEQEAELRAHMESCAYCKHVYNSFMGISNAISSDLVKPPESLSKGIMYRIDAQGKSKKPRFFAFGSFTTIAACLVLILFGASRLGWFDGLLKTASPQDSISEGTSISDSAPNESEDTPESQIENSPEDKSEDSTSNNNDKIMFTAPMTTNSGSENATLAGNSLSELFASNEIKIFKGSFDETNNASPLIIADGNIHTELFDILGDSGIQITEDKLSDTPDYTLLFPDETELYLYSMDSSIYCKLKNCDAVYIAAGTMDEFENFIEQTESAQ